MRPIAFLLMMILLSACSTASDQQANQITSSLPTARKVDLARAAKFNVALGLGYLKKGMPTRAKQKLLMALKQAPRSYEASSAMGYFLEKTNDYQGAEKYYRKAIRLAPHQGEPLNNYGTFLCRQKKYKKSIHYFMQALKMHDYLETAAAYENAGLCASKMPNNISQAKHFFTLAISQDAKRLTSLYEMSELTYQEKKYREAEFYLNRYFKLTKPSARTALLAYRIATRLGQKNKAASYALLLRSKHSKTSEYAQLKAARKS